MKLFNHLMAWLLIKVAKCAGYSSDQVLKMAERVKDGKKGNEITEGIHRWGHW